MEYRINVQLSREVKQRSESPLMTSGEYFYSNKVSKGLFASKEIAIKSFNKMVASAKKQGIEILNADLVSFNRVNGVLNKVSTEKIA